MGMFAVNKRNFKLSKGSVFVEFILVFVPIVMIILVATFAYLGLDNLKLMADSAAPGHDMAAKGVALSTVENTVKDSIEEDGVLVSNVTVTTSVNSNQLTITSKADYSMKMFFLPSSTVKLRMVTIGYIP